MDISRRVSYSWTCPACGGRHESAVWRILYADERPDVLDQQPQGLAHLLCPDCGAFVWIDAPLLVIRPGDPLPLLLALPEADILQETPNLGSNLAQEAQAQLPRHVEGVFDPMIPFPRFLLQTILTRNPVVDATNPKQACEEVSQHSPELAGWYEDCLAIINETEQDRRVSKTLNELRQVKPDRLADFLRARPELRSKVAEGTVSRLTASRLQEGESDPLLEARRRLVGSLAQGRSVTEAADEYLESISGFVEDNLRPRLNSLLTALQTDTGSMAISHLREALNLLASVGADDELEAGIAADLGSRLLDQLGAEGVDEAISVLNRALQLIPEDHSRWPIVAGNLAGAYSSRWWTDQAENWAIAWELLRRACDKSDRDKDPRTWATNHTNYAYLLAERPGGSTDEDLREGITHVKLALEERPRTRDPVDWAFSQLHLGLLYSRRGDREEAAECYRISLSYLRPEDNLQLWGTLANNLADSLLSRDILDTVAAEATVTSALQVIDEDRDPLTVGRLLWQLARAAEQTSGIGQRPIALRQRALRLLTPRLAPRLHLDIGAELADTLAQLGDWRSAADVYDGMQSAFESLHDAQTSQEGRRIILRAYPRLSRWAAYVLARAGRPVDAVIAIERGRARELGTSARREAADLSRLESVDAFLAQRYESTLAEYQAALAGASQVMTPVSSQEMVAAEGAFRRIVGEIRAVPGFGDFFQPMALQDVVEATGGIPTIYLVSAPGGTYLLTVRNRADSIAEVDALHVPTVTSRDVAGVTVYDMDADRPGIVTAQTMGDAPLRAALDQLSRLRPIAQALAATIRNDRQRRAVVVPTGLLGLVPLYAIPFEDTGGSCLDDVAEIRFTPSAAVYGACCKRASQPATQRLVGIADTEPENPLRGSRAELMAIASLFRLECRTLAVGQDATRSWLLRECTSASHLHLACHGYADFADAFGGTLVLGEKSHLEMSDLVEGRLQNCRVAVASACQSGHYGVSETPEEFLGLPAGLLQAGAACAAVSLWPVNDYATALLITRFYELLDPNLRTDQQEPVAALRAARAWLRRLTKHQAEKYVSARPELARELTDLEGENSPGESASAVTLPFSSPEVWASFATYGC